MPSPRRNVRRSSGPTLLLRNSLFLRSTEAAFMDCKHASWPDRSFSWSGASGKVLGDGRWPTDFRDRIRHVPLGEASRTMDIMIHSVSDIGFVCFCARLLWLRVSCLHLGSFPPTRIGLTMFLPRTLILSEFLPLGSLRYHGDRIDGTERAGISEATSHFSKYEDETRQEHAGRKGWTAILQRCWPGV